MGTRQQVLGKKGEELVCEHVECPNCKDASSSLRRLPGNFKCADIICDFCGYLAQVKTRKVRDIGKIPNEITGGAWAPQKKALKAGIYFPLFVVLRAQSGRFAIYYLSADLQTPKIFRPRKPLRKKAQRSGWQGFRLDLSVTKKRFVCLWPRSPAG